MSSSALADSFEYICYGSTANRPINIFTVTARGLTSESDVYRRQILTSKVDPRAVRVKPLLTIIVVFNCFFLSAVG